jgi:hypothetical protein
MQFRAKVVWDQYYIRTPNIFQINLDRFVMLRCFIPHSCLQTTTFSRISTYNNRVSDKRNFLLV